MMDAPLCRDCRWVKTEKTHYDFKYLACAHESLLSKRSVVDGKRRMRTVICESMRSFECGPDGKLFQPRVSWWRRLMEHLTSVAESDAEREKD